MNAPAATLTQRYDVFMEVLFRATKLSCPASRTTQVLRLEQ
jgi:hypothetical protein